MFARFARRGRGILGIGGWNTRRGSQADPSSTGEMGGMEGRKGGGGRGVCGFAGWTAVYGSVVKEVRSVNESGGERKNRYIAVCFGRALVTGRGGGCGEAVVVVVEAAASAGNGENEQEYFNPGSPSIFPPPHSPHTPPSLLYPPALPLPPPSPLLVHLRASIHFWKEFSPTKNNHF